MKGESDLRFRGLRRVRRLREREGSEKGDGNQAKAQVGKVSLRESLSFRLRSLLPSHLLSFSFPPTMIFTAIMPHRSLDVKRTKVVIFSQNGGILTMSKSTKVNLSKFSPIKVGV